MRASGLEQAGTEIDDRDLAETVNADAEVFEVGARAAAHLDPHAAVGRRQHLVQLAPAEEEAARDSS